MESFIGKVIRAKFIEKKDKYYLAKEIGTDINVFVEDEGIYYEEELIGNIEKCIIVDEIKGNYIGIILSNRKFINDIKRIDQELRTTPEYDEMRDIYLVERLKIQGKMVGLYLVDEGNVAKYYFGTREIGIYYKKMPENNILFKENSIENELANQIRDVVRSVDLQKKEISLIQEREKEKELIQKSLELDEKEEIKKIVTIDLQQKIEDKRMQKNLSKSMSQKPELKTEKDINVKQELKMQSKVTDMKTLGQVLEKNEKLPQMKGKKFVKMGVIESDSRDELINEKGENVKANTTRYSFVAIASDGTVVPMDLEQDHQEGNNPREQNLQVSREGKVKQDDVLSRYKIGEGTIAIQNSKYGELKVYHSPRKTIGGKDIEGNKSLDRELETSTVWSLKKNEKDLAQEYQDGYKSVEEGYLEANKHKDKEGKLDIDHLTIDDVDGEKNTKSHIHDTVNYDELATKWGYFDDGKPDTKKAMELFEEKRKANPKKETEEVIEMVTEELDEQYRNNNDRSR
ncbi:MAG: hypothetical protein J6M60_06825 [Clostridia bacterium]|nr:hypothetical protein [Clostridia bacterium]